MIGICCLVLAVLGWAWRASKRRLGSCGAGPREAVVVLGYRNRRNRINAVNRWRVRAGLRSMYGAEARLILSGGSPGGGRPEAELMADYARSVLGYRGPLDLETTSRSTWENIRNVIPLLEDADRIKIVSHSLHAEKARAYLWHQRPDLATHLTQAHDYHPGEWFPLNRPVAGLGRLAAR